MLQTFYQSKPERDTPCRELILDHGDKTGWRVRLLACDPLAEAKRTTITEISVKDFDHGKVQYDRIFKHLEETGWKAYTPYEKWS